MVFIVVRRYDSKFNVVNSQLGIYFSKRGFERLILSFIDRASELVMFVMFCSRPEPRGAHLDEKVTGFCTSLCLVGYR